MLVILSACVIVVCVNNAESAVINFERLCQSTEIDYGFRKGIWQQDAVHFCFPSPILNNKCQTIAATRGINCTTVGENYFLQGGKPGRQAVCCEKKGMTLTNCSRAKKTFSFTHGFNIMYFERVLRELISTPSAGDVTEFEIELCDPVTDAAGTSSGTLPPLPTDLKLNL
ncbi:uncharacterized protein LOC125647214 [Ostrea edulis]|uniref:uncharacterized protein LOC125647214 n=1 Tax=Ostrea edulis TaxID=37623 RepID=UPI0024AF6FD6|nr:uncharacterized protein LOC125647214 [Ostrea edulis]